MAVEVQFLGRLGNNLFQYALGRIIAETLGYELLCGVPPASSAVRVERLSGDDSQLRALGAHFPGASLHVTGTTVLWPHERYVLGESIWSGHGIPLKAILKDTGERRIILRGFFQRAEYFAPYKDQIRSWFKPRTARPRASPHPDDVILHVRRGLDYLRLGWAIEPEYYVRLLEQLDARKVYVCGVGVDDKVRAALRPYAPIYYSGPPMEAYAFISDFNRIVLSNSTFAWWAAWLSEAAEVYFPRCRRGIWGEEYPDMDLEVQESRYRYVDNVAVESWRPFRRNRRVPIKFSESRFGGSVVMSIGDGRKRTRLKVSPVCRAALEWIEAQDRSFGFMDLPQVEAREAKHELQRILYVLVTANGIHADDTFRAAMQIG